MKTRIALVLSTLVAFLWLSSATGADMEKRYEITYDSQVLVNRGGVTVTLADFIAYMDRVVPEADQTTLVSNPSRIEGILENVLNAEAFIKIANDEGYLKDPVAQARLMSVVSREVRTLFREKFFEENELDSYTQQARELFMVNPGQFKSPTTLDLEQVLVEVSGDQTEVEAMERVVDAYQALVAGTPFDEVVAKYSDDPTKDENGGRLEKVNPEDLVRPVQLALEGLAVNTFSQPIRSRFGWHVFRIVKVNEPEQLLWEQARPAVEAMARERHLQRAYERILRELNREEMIFEEGAVEAVLNHYGLDGFNPLGLNSGTPTLRTQD